MKYKQYRYSMFTADEEGIHVHPQQQMINLGFKLLDAVPITIADCWLFTVENDIESIPNYLIPVEYSITEMSNNKNEKLKIEDMFVKIKKFAEEMNMTKEQKFLFNGIVCDILNIMGASENTLHEYRFK